MLYIRTSEVIYLYEISNSLDFPHLLIGNEMFLNGEKVLTHIKGGGDTNQKKRDKNISDQEMIHIPLFSVLVFRKQPEELIPIP